jgi:hypothetical protein
MDDATPSGGPPIGPESPSPPSEPEIASGARPSWWAALRGRLVRRAPAEAEAAAAPVPVPEPTRPTEPRADGPRLVRRAQVDPAARRTIWPAWLVSLVVHGAILGALAAATQAPHAARAIAQLNAAMVDTSLSASQADEVVHILADPTNQPRDLASAEITTTPGMSGGLTSIGAPSATPTVSSSAPVAPGEGSGAPVSLTSNGLPQLSGLAIKPSSSMLTQNVGGGLGGMIAGDVTRVTTDVGEALDQMAREILRHVQDHKLLVVWLFDESNSMKDDQQAIKQRFDRITSELARNVDPDQAAEMALTHVVASFGQTLHIDLPQPTADFQKIAQAIDRIRVDESGVESTFHAVEALIRRYAVNLGEDRRMILVLVTDESGDDGDEIEQARLAAVKTNVSVYVIGRQSLFGRAGVTLPYKDPVTGDEYWPQIQRGPESAALENLQYDGLHGRWDEQPSGFAPYELARLTKDTGGIYFLLPSEEALRSSIRQREKAYSMATLKEYVPDYESRAAYAARASKSPLRRSLLDIVQQTTKGGFRRHFPVEPEALAQAIAEELPKVQQQLTVLLAIEKRLKGLESERDREPDKRWQAHYDLMRAQVVAYQVQAYEYGATLTEMLAKLQAGQLKPKQMPEKDRLVVEWVIDHNPTLRADKVATGPPSQEAKRLFNLVLERHPNSPWADLARDELDRGFGCQWSEYHHTAQYDDRAKLVPKY